MISIAETVIKEEYERSKEHIEYLVKEIKPLPKGTIVYKKGYTYLRYRVSGKKSPVDKYIKASDKQELEKKLNKRKRLEQQLKNRLENIKFIMKSLRIKKREDVVHEAMILIHGRRVRND